MRYLRVVLGGLLIVSVTFNIILINNIGKESGKVAATLKNDYNKPDLTENNPIDKYFGKHPFTDSSTIEIRAGAVLYREVWEKEMKHAYKVLEEARAS